jgi:dihydroxyacetone kinase DhaKLM complex PTS-EIIA-like component DhaM
MLQQVARGVVPVAVAGDTIDGRLGTNPLRVVDAIREILDDSGVLVIVDIGSSILAMDMAIEMLEPQEQSLVVVSGGPFVEGAIMAAVEASIGASLGETATAASSANQLPKLLESEGADMPSWHAPEGVADLANLFPRVPRRRVSEQASSAESKP